MRNYRFYQPHITKPEFLINDETTLHKMNNVLRLSPDSKELIEFFDGSGLIYVAHLKTINKKEAIFIVENEYQSARELKSKVKFYVPVIKPENFYWMLRKLTEIGVAELQPVFFARSQKKYKESLEKQKDKILNIIQEAVEQCGAAIIPKYHDIVAFTELTFSETDNKNIRFFAYEELSLEKNAKKAQAFFSSADTVTVVETLVGPEGGLTTDETGKLGDKDFIAVSLGARLLKAETAAITLFASLGLD